ncbi:MoxR-like ATPase [Streptomyces venezuelae]|uniref:AAA family ATPase n=1 Tax=Streptomyces gardneri TaxID=66892 RepID=UPI0006BC6EED|nr:AAA family ATPase [Streptomyces gardneri]ALO08317.1 MoxR-like ATPase [Streptomyces venezuelae]QPK45541.1 AAA family ATPase [Streptomyces gardneri]WRK36884.1 AAA family ATPase [Streptomyces venezuelae]CUM41331.1 MoxR-like ATPases [Streptomyces venezuelae]
MTDNWRLFKGGDAEPHEVTEWPAAPPWRTFGRAKDDDEQRKRVRHVIADENRDTVNAALHLHRPLLVTGGPGTGKSTLARAIADELMLDEVLHWPVNSRSTLTEGLYRYDAVGRLRDASLARRDPDSDTPEPGIGDYLRLGPLGTALLPAAKPRVLLIDELDKGDVDLPNDLLTVFEEGTYEIPELARLTEKWVDVRTADSGTLGMEETEGTSRSDERVGKVAVENGRVTCQVFPVVVITSNGERDFPPAFLRRCVRLELRQPDEEQLRKIVRMHLGDGVDDVARDLIADFLERRESHSHDLATDQLLNAVHLRVSGVDFESMRETVLRSLAESEV